MDKILEKVCVGEVFSIAGFEFIKFYDENGNTVAVAKDSWFDSTFGGNNNFAESEPLKRLKEEFLPKIEAAIGAENIVEHEVDLLSLDGSDKWGKIKTKVSLPTFDFYRKHGKVFDNYKLDKRIFDKYNHKLDQWWWLATPDSTSEHTNDYWVTCVAPSGNINRNYGSYDNYGVRPFWIFVSSISVSCKSED